MSSFLSIYLYGFLSIKIMLTFNLKFELHLWFKVLVLKTSTTRRLIKLKNHFSVKHLYIRVHSKFYVYIPKWVKSCYEYSSYEYSVYIETAWLCIFHENFFLTFTQHYHDNFLWLIFDMKKSWTLARDIIFL